VESTLGPLCTAATPGLLYLPRVIVRIEKLVEWTVLVGASDVLGENLPRRHFVHYKSHLPDPGANPGRRGGKPATNRFSYGAAVPTQLTTGASLFLPKGTERHKENWKWNKKSEHLLDKFVKWRSGNRVSCDFYKWTWLYFAWLWSLSVMML
jgi:hypothetical protein